MREILNDLETGGKPDPMRSAQASMRPPLPKRFYKIVSVVASEAGHEVHLDGKPVLTPGRRKLLLPTAAAAGLVAAEYDGQGDVIDPATIPVTRLANTALDGVAADPQAVMEDILRYASSDLLCYRADAPQALVDRQAEAWDPVLDWARSALGARFFLAEGVMHVQQPRETIAVLGAHLRQLAEPMRLAALHVMTSLAGSALLAMATEAGVLAPEEAWSAAHIDEDWNVEQWGEDHEAAARRTARRQDFDAAVSLLTALDKKPAA